VFVGVHYPLDIFAGGAIGLFSAWLGEKLFGKSPGGLLPLKK
jgi:membrane-associated phospholipid phosphatase